MKHIRLLALLIVLLMAPYAAGAGDTHFSELRAFADRHGPQQPLSPETAARLAEELAVERLLWDDEVAYHRNQLASAGADAGIERLETIDAEVQGLFDSAEQMVAAGAAPDAELLARILDCGERRDVRPILSGTPLRPSRPPEPRPARLAEQPPARYYEPPQAEMWSAVAITKGAEDPGGWDADPSYSDPVTLKARELGHDPVALYQFVLNQIRPEHYFGAVKSAATVLNAGGGNDADQAALLAALYRASGYPARVAWGVQEFRIASLVNHFGVDTPELLEQALTRAGIPWTAVITGGQVQAYRLERCWCEVWMPFANFRGVVLDSSGVTWARLDPQLKPMAESITERLILDESGFDPDGFLDDFLAGAYCSADLDQAGACPTAREALAQQINQYLADMGETLTYDHFAAIREISEESMPILPASMVGGVVAVNGAGLEYPESLQHTLHLVADHNGTVLLDATVPVAALAGREAALWYAPATPDDELILKAYYGQLSQVPPYLINLTPQLLAEREELARGTAGIGVGRAYELTTTLTTPGGATISFTNHELTAVPSALAISAGRQGYTIATGEAASTVEILSALADDALTGKTLFEEEMAAIAGLSVVHRVPSLTRVGSVVEPDGTFGLVRALDWKGLYVDADVWGARVAGGTAEEERSWLLLTHLQASALERSIFEAHDVTSVSADKVLMLAADAGIPVVRVDQGNLGAALPPLGLAADVEAEIEAWVLAGGEALVPASPLTYLSWSGIGYLLLDPASGETRYQLAGALSGGMNAIPSNLNPWQQAVSNVTHTQVIQNGNPASIEIAWGNYQNATVNEVLTLGNGSTLAVQVFDHEGRLVNGAIVTFKVQGGDGELYAVTANTSVPGVDTLDVTTQGLGIAAVQLRLGEKTEESPLYRMRSASDTYLTRLGLNLISASITSEGIELDEPFYEFAWPGPLDHLVTSGDAQTGMINLSLGQPLRVIPADAFENPISNLKVRFSLLEPEQPQDDEVGPVFLAPKDECRRDTIIARECGGSIAYSEIGGVSGVSVDYVLGPKSNRTYHAVAKVQSSPVNELTKIFTMHSQAIWVSPFQPAVILTRRAQPINGAGQSVEAYLHDAIRTPGDLQPIPLETSLILVEQKYKVERCDPNECMEGYDYKIVALDEFTTRRIKAHDPPLSSCGPQPDDSYEGCPYQPSPASGRVIYRQDGYQEFWDRGPDADGNFTGRVTLPGPGRYTVEASGKAYIPLPVQPEGAERGEIELCPTSTPENPCALLEWQFYPPEDSGNDVSFTIYGVEAKVVDPVPHVVIDQSLVHRVDTLFEYELLPADYPALSVTMDFLEDGAVVATAEHPGRGHGTARLGQGSFFQLPSAPHAVRMSVNNNWVFAIDSNTTYPMTLRFAEQDMGLHISMLNFTRDNSIITSDPLMVSKYMTSRELPTTAAFPDTSCATPPCDRDTYRVEVSDLPQSLSPIFRVEVPAQAYSHDFGSTFGMSQFGSPIHRSDQFIRLVSNDIDDGHAGNQTIKVELGDRVFTHLMLNGRIADTVEAMVGEPASAQGINAIRRADVRFLLVNHADVVANADVDVTTRRMSEAWAQCSVYFESTRHVVQPVRNIIVLEGISTSKGTFSIELRREGDSQWTSITPLSYPRIGHRAGADEIAEQIAQHINTLMGAGTAYAFDVFADPQTQPLTLVVVQRGVYVAFRNLVNTIPNVDIMVPQFNMADSDLYVTVPYNNMEGWCLAANNADRNPDTLDVFVVKRMVGAPPDLHPRGNAYPTGFVGQNSEMRNIWFMVLSAADTPADNPHTAGHEAGRILLDFFPNVDSRQYNLMNNTHSTDSITANKRLEPDQHTASRTQSGTILKQ
ncbi:MAG: hypothetical protein GY856_10565 [bacterium]|nr:hypothetical protein [bacterium]